MPNLHQVITQESNTLIDLLVAQCSDLQKLLSLARRETVAVQENDFDELLSITSERTKLGNRLESYHRQIAELRDAMGETGERIIESNVAREAVKLVTEIQTSDAASKTALALARTQTGESLSRLERGHRSSAAYLQDGKRNSLNYDQRL